jgi:FKBP-type peptidyl-prolyl cis-trans isomerase SlyD
VERAVEGAEEGEEFEVSLGADDGYGDRDPSGVFMVPRAAFPADEGVVLGMTYSGVRADGEQVIFRVVRDEGEVVLVDTNHPLAGKALRVWVVVREVRDATPDELHHGRVRTDEDMARLPS